MKTLEEYRGKKVKFLSNEQLKIKEPKLGGFVFDGPLVCGVGIEVEVENAVNCTEMKDNHFWTFDKDGSLRNNGIELKTIPLSTSEQVISALNILDSWIKENKKLDFSWRTSIHIHLDLSAFDANGIGCLSLNYLVVEPLLFKSFAPTRKDSIFCVPLGESEQLSALKGLFSAIKSKKDGEWPKILRDGWDLDEKYSAINFYRILEFGTVEFRHMAGTGDVKVIANWISSLQNLVRFSKEQKFASLVKKICELNVNSHYQQFLRDVFLDCAKEFQFNGYEDYIAEGVRKVKALLFSGSQQSKDLITPTKGISSRTEEKFLEKKKKRFERDFGGI